MIKNIVFDIGDVLINFRWYELMQELGLSEEEIARLNQSMFLSQYWAKWDEGIFTEEEVIEAIKKDSKGLENKVDEFFDRKGELVRLHDYSVEWMKNLKERGYKIYLLSNYPVSAFELHSKLHFKFLPLIDGKIVSGYVKMVKPNKNIYECLLDTYHLKAEECIFIDNREENIQGAKSVGMQGIVFKDYKKASIILEHLLENGEK